MAASTKLNTLVRIPGGKRYLAEWIISNFPQGYEDLVYIEGFLGGGSCLLRKNPSQYEIANDIDSILINLWKVVSGNPSRLQELLRKVVYDEATFHIFRDSDESFIVYEPTLTLSMRQAVREYCLRRMSRAGLKHDFGWSDRTRGGRPEYVNQFYNAIENIGSISNRVRNVEFRCTDTPELLVELKDQPVAERALIYLDAPYLHETRTSKNLYEFEMTDEQHEAMLRIIQRYPARLVVSGYPSTLYNDYLTPSAGWRLITKDIANHASQAKTKGRKTECLWLNY